MTPPAFQAKTILVVGAGRQDGIAFACARMLAAQGGTVALADLPGSDAKNLVELLPEQCGHSYHPLDVTDSSSVTRAVASVVARHGRIDAALLGSAVLRNQPFLDIAAEDWERTFAVNCTGMFVTAQAVARQMLGNGGRIVAVASNAGRVPRLHNASYGASKAAVIHLVKCMALELAPYKINVNALCPGSTATSMALDNKSEGNPEKIDNLIRGSLDEWRTGIPLGRLADADDQAAAATFLLSDAARHITGQALCVDGGQTFC
ncbi:MAG TPA: SDR family oxidoreductase [Bosea sp. (in: a-proteobacteria)]|jgi:2,3-dihydro-2,3-dihydroxybenzoate dehydrogenase|nr:SDR family oxidoreductase [Bosea sp. (in: a-proteobacteria)]